MEYRIVCGTGGIILFFPELPYAEFHERKNGGIVVPVTFQVLNKKIMVFPAGTPCFEINSFIKSFFLTVIRKKKLENL
jgi:hypothetical protein